MKMPRQKKYPFPFSRHFKKARCEETITSLIKFKFDFVLFTSIKDTLMQI